MDLSLKSKFFTLVTIAAIVVTRQSYWFCYRCKYMLIFIGILTAFQVKSQSGGSLSELGYHEPENKYDSIYYELFKTYRSSDKLKAKYYAKEVLYFSGKHKHFTLQTKAFRALGYLYRKNNQPDSANILYHKGIQISSLYGINSVLIDLYNDVGALHEQLDIYDSALHYFMLSYDLASQHQSYKLQAIASHNIGVVYSYLENYDEALLYIKKTIAIESKLGITEGLNTNLISVARVLNEKGLYHDALEQLNKVKSNCKTGCDDITLADLYYGLGYSNLKNGAAKEAYDFFIKALTLARRNEDNKQTLANTLYHLSTFAYDRKAYPEALEYLNESEKIAKEINHRRLLRDVYNQLSVIYDENGSTRKAFHYQKLYVQLKDSIFNEGVANNIKVMQLAEQRKQSDHIIKNKDIALREKATVLFKTNIVAILLTVNCILAFMVIYFFYRSLQANKRHKQKLEDELFKLVDIHQTNQRQLSIHQMEFNYLLSRVTGFFSGPIHSLIGLSNISKSITSVEEAQDYARRIGQICLRDITGVLDNIIELTGARTTGVVVESFDLKVVAEELYRDSKIKNAFPLLNVSIPKECTALRTDKDHFVLLISNAIRYFICYKNGKPVEVNFSQQGATTVIDIQYEADHNDVISHEKLFNLFSAQILALKLKGGTILARRDDYAVLKIMIPTDFDTTTDKTPELSAMAWT